MRTTNFLKAIELIAECHTTEITINKVRPNGQVSQVLANPTIHIKDCCEGVVNRLIEVGFGVGMDNGLLKVSDRTV